MKTLVNICLCFFMLLWWLPAENGLFLVVLAIFATQSHGFEVFNIISPSNNGGNIQETMTIDNEKNTAIVNIHAGSCSSTTVFDYKHGYIASRILSRRACYVMKMNHDAIPALDQLKRFIYERKALKTMSSTEYTWVKYNPLQSWFTDMKWYFFGSPIEQLCKHLPLYKAEVVEKPHDAGAHGCVKAGLLGILGISICGGIDV